MENFNVERVEYFLRYQVFSKGVKEIKKGVCIIQIGDYGISWGESGGLTFV